MGADAFHSTAMGKTVEEAFIRARDEAQYEYGHGGYTGTIAEKGSFEMIPRVPRVKSIVVADTIQAAAYGDKKAMKKLVGWYNDHYAQRLVRLYDDKWGVALAIQGTDAETKAARERYEKSRAVSYKMDRLGREIPGTRKYLSPSARGMNLYHFFGIASS